MVQTVCSLQIKCYLTVPYFCLWQSVVRKKFETSFCAIYAIKVGIWGLPMLKPLEAVG